MAEKLTLEVVTPYGSVLKEEVDEVVASGTEGDFGVLPGHISFLSALKIGMLVYKKGGTEKYVFINSGYAQVLDNTVLILADSAEKAEDIDVERAKESMRLAEERFKKKEAFDFASSEAILGRALMRLQVAEKRRG